ncbi:MAG: cupin domain-containing protein [Opitutaceae bacterium]
MTATIKELTATNYKNASVLHTGALDKWKYFNIALPQTGDVYPGKFWLKELLQLSGTEVSFGSMPKGGSVPYNHIHKQNEELYIFLSGQGQMLLDGEQIDVSAGTVVRVDPQAVRCWRNTGTEDLVHIVIQSKAGSLEEWTVVDGEKTPGAPIWE